MFLRPVSFPAVYTVVSPLLLVRPCGTVRCLAGHRALKDSFTQLRAQSEVSLNTLSTDTGWDAKSAAKNCLSRGCILDESCSYHTLGEYCYRGARQPCCFASGAPFDRDNVR